MFEWVPDMNHDGKKDWFDGFLFHEMIREAEESENEEREEDDIEDVALFPSETGAPGKAEEPSPVSCPVSPSSQEDVSQSVARGVFRLILLTLSLSYLVLLFGRVFPINEFAVIFLFFLAVIFFSILSP